MERAGISDRESWRRIGEAGYLGASMPAAYGGGGGDFLHEAIIIEELAYAARARAADLAAHRHLHAVLAALRAASAQKQRFLRARDHAATAARDRDDRARHRLRPRRRSRRARVRDGDDYVINGAKTFISNGQNCDLVIVVAKTDPDANPRTAASRCSWSRPSRPASCAARSSTRWAARPGHERAVLRGLPRAGEQRARRRRAGLHDS